MLRNGRVIFTTLIPDSDICAYGGRSWLMDMDALGGSRLAYSPFDLNRDSEYNATDYVELDGVKVAVTGRGSDSILTQPAFLSALWATMPIHRVPAATPMKVPSASRVPTLARRAAGASHGDSCDETISKVDAPAWRDAHRAA